MIPAQSDSTIPADPASTTTEDVSLMDLPVSTNSPGRSAPESESEADLLALPVRKFQPGRQDVSPAERTLRFQAIDLAHAPWFASSDLPPSASPDQIAMDASATSPIAILRAPRPFDRATLFCILYVESSANLPAMLTIGHIDGNDETFLNGRLIGSTDTYDSGSSGNPRAYKIESGWLRKGANILAIRLQGTNGRSTFGIVRPPLTFQYLPKGSLGLWSWPRTPVVSEYRTPLDTSIVLSLMRTIPQGTIISADNIKQRERGWGRFGHSVHDGLPAVEFVSPLRMRNRTAPGLEVLHDVVTAVDLEPTSHPVTAFRKGFQVEARHSQQSFRYNVTWSVLYPGLRLEGTGGQILPLRIQFSGPGGQLVPLTGGVARNVDTGSDAEVYIAWQPRSRSCPMLIAVRGGVVNMTRFEEHVDLSIRARENRQVEIHAWYPTGISTFDLRGLSGTNVEGVLEKMAAERSATSGSLLGMWLRTGLHFPVEANDWFVDTSSTVRIVTAARFVSLNPEPWLDDWKTIMTPAVPRPPLVDLLVECGLLAPDRGRFPSGVITWTGPLYVMSDPLSLKSPAGENFSATFYDLFLPAFQTRLLPRAEEIPETRRTILNDMIEDFGTSTAPTAVGMLGSSAEAFRSLWPQLDTQRQQQMVSQLEPLLAMSLRAGPPWSETTEPLTGLNYLVSGEMVGPGEEPAEIDSPLLRFLALVCGARHVIPNSSIVQDRLPQLRRIAGYLWMADDWAWMKPVSSARGLNSGGGWAAFAHVAALQGILETAEAANDQQLTGLARYHLARAMVSLVARLSMRDWPTFGPVQSSTTETLLLSFNEGGAPSVADPSAVSGPALEAALGVYGWPVVTETLLKLHPEAFRDYLSRLSRSWQRIVTAQRSVSSLDAEARDGLAHLLAIRARLRMDSKTTLDEVERQLAANRPPPNPGIMARALLESAHRDLPDLALIHWTGLELLSFELTAPEGNRDRRSAKIRVRPLIPGRELHLRLEQVPQSVSLNGGPIPLTDVVREGNVLKITVRRQGESTVEVRF